jgi:hypothetical protein
VNWKSALGVQAPIFGSGAIGAAGSTPAISNESVAGASWDMRWPIWIRLRWQHYSRIPMNRSVGLASDS